MRGAEESAECCAAERASDADAADTERRECREVERRDIWRSGAKTCKHVDGTIDGTNEGGDVVFAREAGCIEDIGASFLKSLQALDGVGEVVALVQVVFSAGGKRKGERERTGGISGSLDSIGSGGDFVDGIGRGDWLSLRWSSQQGRLRRRGAQFARRLAENLRSRFRDLR